MSKIVREVIGLLDKWAGGIPEWAEGKAFKHPETGNQVQFSSLPSKEQSRLREEHSKKNESVGTSTKQLPVSLKDSPRTANDDARYKKSVSKYNYGKRMSKDEFNRFADTMKTLENNKGKLGELAKEYSPKEVMLAVNPKLREHPSKQERLGQLGGAVVGCVASVVLGNAIDKHQENKSKTTPAAVRRHVPREWKNQKEDLQYFAGMFLGASLTLGGSHAGAEIGKRFVSDRAIPKSVADDMNTVSKWAAGNREESSKQAAGAEASEYIDALGRVTSYITESRLEDYQKIKDDPDKLEDFAMSVLETGAKKAGLLEISGGMDLKTFKSIL